MNRTTGRVVWMLAVAGLLIMPGLAQADVDFGVRGGFYSDADAGFLGGEALIGLTRAWYFNPNIEYVFVDDGSLWTANADFHYDFPTHSNLAVWAGGGPAVIFSSIDPPRGCRNCDSNDQTDLGLNLLGGVGFSKRGPIRPYVQGKVTLSDNTEAAIAFGLRFY
ncbi:MAG TPA: hypothetical protein VKM72_35015 [Thermoanaerobaculia bacterium]|nr:hypothetical protein [Thermoanaerobaculia bacterium]